MKWPWSKPSDEAKILDALRTLKEKAVASRNEFSRVGLMLDGGGDRAKCAAMIHAENAVLMAAVAAAQALLQEKGAVKRSGRAS